MPRIPLHAVVWSEERRCYDLYTRGRLERGVRPLDHRAWLAWIDEVTSFAFHGAAGNLNVYQESGPRGGRYWYAYHTVRHRTRKRYVGASSQLTFSRMEEVAQDLAREPSVSAQAAVRNGSSSGQTLATLPVSLGPPRLPLAIVERQRLLATLDMALSTPVTLISAAAGWGKTTLLADWARRQRAYIAWLSLDSLDGSPTRFWVSLIGALRNCGGYSTNIGETAFALLQSPQPPSLSTLLSSLLHELENQPRDHLSVVLILDDYHVISDPLIHEGIRILAELLPKHVHLIISSRVDPSLPLARWRVRGQLTEIRTTDLSTSLSEACEFLRHMLSSPLTEDEVRLLVQRTEGWIGGLHLAALAMRQQQDPTAFLQTFNGSQRYLLDYVQEEILSRLPREMRDFLLHTAILSRLDASICQAVTQEHTSAQCQQMLVSLERANLFLVPLDEERRWYRLHDLFREALLAALRSTQPAMQPVLHRRAAQYYAAREQWSEAIDHWLTAGDFSMAAKVMEETVEHFWLRGEAAAMAHWVTSLPQELVREHAGLFVTATLYLINTVAQTTEEERARVRQQAWQLIARVETALRPHEIRPGSMLPMPDADWRTWAGGDDLDGSIGEDSVLRRRLRLLGMHMVEGEALARGEFGHLAGNEHKILEELDREDEPIWQIVPLSFSFVIHFSIRGDSVRLIPRLLEAEERARRSGSRFATIKVMQWLALSANQAGQLHLAYRESLAALDLIEQMAGYALLRGYFEAVLASVLYQWNRLSEARKLLHTVLDAGNTWQQLDLLGSGYAGLVQIELARRDWSLAQQAQEALEQVVQRERFANLPNLLPTIRAQRLLTQGEITIAAAWAATTVFPMGAWNVVAHASFPVVVRVHFAQRRWREALQLLERWKSQVDRPEMGAVRITFLAQLLVALHHTGERGAARRLAIDLFALTEPEGHLRVYLDEGDPMRQALEGLLSPDIVAQRLTRSAMAYVSRLLSTFAQQENETSRSTSATTPEPAPYLVPEIASVPYTPGAILTQREQEVLKLLADGASNKEIAEQLFVELPTVKKHVSSLLHKLGATNRARAVIRARSLSLI